MLDECACKSCSTDDLLIPANPAPPPSGMTYWNDAKRKECTPEHPCAWCATGSVNSYPPLTNYAEHTPVTLSACTSPSIVPVLPLAVRLRDEDGPPLPQMIAQRRAQLLVHPRTIIAFTGLAGSGKSTAAAHLCDVHGFERVRFAGPLKAMMTALGLTYDEIEGNLKEVPCALLGGKTPRYAMQTIGTEWGRDIIDRDLWIRAWQAAVDRLPAAVPVVVDDCRFPNEAEAVRAAGGFLVRVMRPGAGQGAAGHSSEGQDLGQVAATLHNTGTPEDLGHHLDNLVRDISWALAAQ